MGARQRIIRGDALARLREMRAHSIDAVVTDPPYELGFMGRAWDGTGIAYSVELWREALRVLKPGGHLLAFGGTRTSHRMVCAIEDAGFEIRDSLVWMYGTGFPKSLNVSKAIDDAAGATREVVGKHPSPARSIGQNGVLGNPGKDTWRDTIAERVPMLTAPATPEAKQWEGWGTALKPAHEPIVLARKPLIGTVAANVLAHGTGGLNVDGCRIGTEARVNAPAGNNRAGVGESVGHFGMGANVEGRECVGRWPANVCLDEWEEQVLRLSVSGAEAAPIREFFRGYCRVPAVQSEGANLPKPEGTDAVLRPGLLVGVAVGDATGDGSSDVASVRGAGTQAPALGERILEVLACDVPAAWLQYFADTGRVVRSPDCAAAMLDEQSEGRMHSAGKARDGSTAQVSEAYNATAYELPPNRNMRRLGDSGGASRFFYCAKASRKERGAGNTHPTVKPVALMRWLVRLVTPPDGLVLDPFAGSGTTGLACKREGLRFLGIEREPAYAAIAELRLAG